MKRWWLGGKGEKNEREGEDGEEKERQTERVKIKKESAQGTMAQKSTQTETAVETVKQDEREFSLTYMVLYCRRMLFALRFKFHKSWHFCFFCFVFFLF